MQTVEVYEQEDAKLEAVLSKAVAKKDTYWSFKDSKINSSIHYNQECDRDLIKHRLIVRDCTLEDSGEYAFSARNNQSKVLLIVKGIKIQM